MIGSKLSQQFKSMSYEDLNDVYRLADYLKLRPLCHSIAIFLACPLLIPLNLKSLNQLKEKYNINKDLTA